MPELKLTARDGSRMLRSMATQLQYTRTKCRVEETRMEEMKLELALEGVSGELVAGVPHTSCPQVSNLNSSYLLSFILPSSNGI